MASTKDFINRAAAAVKSTAIFALLPQRRGIAKKRNDQVQTEARNGYVTAEDIVSCIQMMLGRTPDQATVDYHLSLGFVDRFALGNYILNIDEFRSRIRNQTLQHFPLGDRVLAATHRGQYMYLIPTDLDLTPSILLTGKFEPHVERVLTSLLRPGDIVVDVGANVGYHTLAMAASVGPTGILYAFEANPHVMRLLKASMVINSFSNFRGTGRVNLHENAVLDEPGSITLAVAPGHYGSGHVVNSAPASDYGADYSTRLEVPGVTLDAALGDTVGTVDLLHMDIEGSEPLAIRGAKGLIDRSPNLKIVMEWSVGMMSARADISDFIAELTGRGFRFRLIEHSGQLADIAASALLNLQHCDVVLWRE